MPRQLEDNASMLLSMLHHRTRANTKFGGVPSLGSNHGNQVRQATRAGELEFRYGRQRCSSAIVHRIRCLFMTCSSTASVVCMRRLRALRRRLVLPRANDPFHAQAPRSSLQVSSNARGAGPVSDDRRRRIHNARKYLDARCCDPSDTWDASCSETYTCVDRGCSVVCCGHLDVALTCCWRHRTLSLSQPDQTLTTPSI